MGRNSLRRHYMTLIGLSLLVVLLRHPSLEQPFDNDSGANAYLARRIVRGEPLYGAHHPAHHLPAVYYGYALAFRLFGDSVWAVKFFLIPWTMVTVCAVYWLGVLVADWGVGLLGAALYAFFSSDVFLFGSSAEIEVFANLPRVAALVVLMSLVRRRARPRWFLFVGLLSGVAFLFKSVYVSALVMTGFVLLGDVWQAGWRRSAWCRAVECGVWTVVGFASLVLLVVGYFWSEGLLSRFFLVFTIGRKYVSLRNAGTSGVLYVFLYPVAGLAARNIVIVVLALAGLVTTLREQMQCIGGRRRSVLARTYLVLWLFLSFVEAGVTRVLFPHYYQLVIPSLAILASWFVLQVYRGVWRMHRVLGIVVLVAVVVASVGVSVKQNLYYYRLYARYRLGTGTYEDFVRYGWNSLAGEEFVRVQELADYVRARTLPTDRIYYWSGGVQVYYLADRLCAIDIVWPIYAEATGPYQRIFGERTKYVIVGESNNTTRPEWLYRELDEGYRLETIIRGQEVYRRLD